MRSLHRAISLASREAASAAVYPIENALLIRRDPLDALAPVLRVYEGCARALLGEVEGANLLKLHRYSGKVTYLVCPELERDPDPPLALRIKVTLPMLAIEVFDYLRREDPPRLGVGPGLLRRAGE